MRIDYWSAENIEKVRLCIELDDATRAELAASIMLLEAIAPHNLELIWSAPKQIGKLLLAIGKSVNISIAKLNLASEIREEIETAVMKTESLNEILDSFRARFSTVRPNEAKK